MNYSDDFPINRGDRVSYHAVCDVRKGRVMGYTDDKITVKHWMYGYETLPIDQVVFLYACPFLLFWQK